MRNLALTDLKRLITSQIISKEAREIIEKTQPKKLSDLFGRIDPAVTNPDDTLKVGMELAAKASKTSNGQLTYVFQLA